MPEKIALLKNGLDKTSQNNIDLYLDRMLFLPDINMAHAFRLSKTWLDSLYTEEERIFSKLYFDERSEYKKQFFMAYEMYNCDTFTFHHGLRYASDKVKKYIENKDFIDGGAWIGDTVLILTKYYNPERVYAFELSPKNWESFQPTMDINGVSKSKYSLVQMGLSDKNEKVLFNDAGGQSGSVFEKGDTETVLTDLDSFVIDKKLNVGFIKTDVEGNGIKALKGMENTIRNYRPVLSLSIYHSPEEFFETKPLLEQIVKEKNYKIEIKNFQIYIPSLTEIALFAYPAELDEGELS
jgi:FkbM family methyltransferase